MNSLDELILDTMIEQARTRCVSPLSPLGRTHIDWIEGRACGAIEVFQLTGKLDKETAHLLTQAVRSWAYFANYGEHLENVYGSDA